MCLVIRSRAGGGLDRGYRIDHRMADLADSGGAKVARALSAAGVRVVFTLCGGHISPILVEAKRAGITVIDVRDEATAVFAADGVARLTGTAGVAAVTAGPGVTNAMTAIKNAQLAQSPLVLLGGATATILKGRGSLQDIDQMALVGPHVKWKTAVKRVADLEGAVRRAVHEAQRGVPGPVFVECPVDLLYPEDVVRGMFLAGFANRAPRSVGERATRWYLNRHLTRVFAPGPAGGAPTAPALRTESPTSSEGHLDRIGQKIARAERPVILVGSQAVTGENAARLAAAVTALALPVYLSGMARGLLGASHPLQFRHQRKQALREADLVILAGTPCDFRLEYGRQINSRATLVSINRSARDLTLNRRPAFAVLGSPCATLERLVDSTCRRAAVATPGCRRWRRGSTIATRRSPPAAAPRCRRSIRWPCAGRSTPSSRRRASSSPTAATSSPPRRTSSGRGRRCRGSTRVCSGRLASAPASSWRRTRAVLERTSGRSTATARSASASSSSTRSCATGSAWSPSSATTASGRRSRAIRSPSSATMSPPSSVAPTITGWSKALAPWDCSPTILRCLERTLTEARAIARTGRPVLVNALIGDTDFRKGSISL